MADITQKIAAQALDVRLVELDAGETLTIAFRPEKNNAPGGAAVNWTNGGAPWTIKPKVDDEEIEVAVDYSLYAEGDEDWTPHQLSPFTEIRQDVECFRVERMRFANAADSNTVYVTVASNAPFTATAA